MGFNWLTLVKNYFSTIIKLTLFTKKYTENSMISCCFNYTIIKMTNLLKKLL